MSTRRALCSSLLWPVGVAVAASPATAQVTAWPAESWSTAVNLTQVESGGAAGTNDFHVDLSGAFWNPLSRRLWLCRNGPANSTSKVWALREVTGGIGAAAWTVDTQGPLRAEWTGFGDAEALTQVDPASSVVYIMAETEEVIRAYDLSVYGTAALLRTYATSAHLPLDGGSGSEAIAFVPDAHLRAAGFVTPAGAPYVSTRGMGGLVCVGHQNGGRIYVFDLSPTSSAFTFVGAYLTGDSDTSDLAFDRSTGRLYILHGNDANTIEVVTMGSTPIGSERRLNTILTYARPTGSATNANIEGLTIGDNTECSSGRRSLFLTVDDGGATSLLWFRQFPCVCRPDFNLVGGLSVQDLFDYLAAYFAGEPRSDFNFSGSASVQDIFDYLEAYFRGC
jgi:hypothetical protein